MHWPCNIDWSWPAAALPSLARTPAAAAAAPSSRVAAASRSSRLGGLAAAGRFMLAVPRGEGGA